MLFKLSSFFSTENEHQSHQKLCKNKDSCNVGMHSENTKILEFNQNQKSDKPPFPTYADIESLIEEIDGYKNNTEHSLTTKVTEHIPSSYSMSTILPFKSIENKHDVSRGKDCAEKLCEPLREHAMKKIDFIKKRKNEVINKWTAELISMIKSAALERKIWK